MVWFKKFTYTADGIVRKMGCFGKFTWFVITSQTPSQASTKNSSSAGFLSFRTIKYYILLQQQTVDFVPGTVLGVYFGHILFNGLYVTLFGYELNYFLCNQKQQTFRLAEAPL
jgi:hypothetical protein